eukprot:4409489-Lingulodinium_polyedra.AAC.1
MEAHAIHGTRPLRRCCRTASHTIGPVMRYQPLGPGGLSLPRCCVCRICLRNSLSAAANSRSLCA